MREFTRRVVLATKEDEFIKDFYRRCDERGVPREFIKKLDLSRTRAVRSIGNGSKAGRLVALREMQGLSGRLDEVGRRNLDRDIVSTTVGHDLANRYLPVSPEPRPTVDIKIAFLENQQLMAGQQVPVVTNEMHGFHLEAHVPVLMQLVEALNTGTADPQQSIEPLQALYQHISETAQAASGDVNLEPMVKDTNRVLQLAEEQINNTFKSLQKIERDQNLAAQQGQEGQGQEQVGPDGQPIPQQPGQPGGGGDTRMREAEIKMEIARRKAELDMELRQKKFDQELAIRDAQAALKFREGANR
jgi:ribosomal protein S14